MGYTKKEIRNIVLNVLAFPLMMILIVLFVYFTTDKKQERIDYINLTIRDKITSAYNAAGGDFIKYGKNREIFFGIDFSIEEMKIYKNLNYDEFLFKGDSIIKNKGETFIQIKPLEGDSFYLYSTLKIEK